MRLSAGVPELGILLGRLAGPAPEVPAALALDHVRLAWVSRLFAAAGAARQAVGMDDLPAARQCLRHAVWLEAWRALASEVAAAVTATATVRLRQVAAEVRLPVAQLARYLPDRAEEQLILHRLEAAGIPLEQVTPPEAAADWHEGLARAARATDASWDRLRRVVEEEVARTDQRAGAVRAWRRPSAALWGLTGLVLFAAVAIGLWLGGMLAPSPPSHPWGTP